MMNKKILSLVAWAADKTANRDSKKANSCITILYQPKHPSLLKKEKN